MTNEETKKIMEIWREILNDYLALFSVAGKKSEKEKSDLLNKIADYFKSNG